MCGIAGVLFKYGGSPPAPLLTSMREVMQERGPDDAGLYIGDRIGLVHRRLSIIDLSSAGRGPMTNEDGSIWVTFNGEIYNYRELRGRLAARGHHFASVGDTEVIVHGYEEWGLDVFARLNGMFAVGLWDARAERLVLATDRLGEKPMWVAETPQRFVFGSTLHAVLVGLESTPDIDFSALDCYFSHGFIPAPHTIFRGVARVRPGRVIVSDARGTRDEAYWSLGRGASLDVSWPEAMDLVEEQVRESVASRLVADVPVGGFLSGGVDSSLVMAMAAEQTRSRLQTFTMSCADATESEVPFARAVAAAIGSEHHEIWISGPDVVESLPELVWQYGQPFGDSSAIPTYLVSRAARGRVKVALSGDGGDESFGGYWHAVTARAADAYRRFVPTQARRALVPALCATLEGLHPGNGAARRLRALNALGSVSVAEAFTNSLTWFGLRDALYRGPLRREAIDHNPVRCYNREVEDAPSDDAVERVMHGDLRVLLPDAYLTKVDVASMTTSLEVRAPLLDHRLVELAWRLPRHFKVGWWERKRLLKAVAARHVPPAVVYRRKVGFALPLVGWWRGPLAPVLRDLMRSSLLVRGGWIALAPVEHALREHTTGRADHSVRLWQILWLEVWFRMVFARVMRRTDGLTA